MTGTLSNVFTSIFTDCYLYACAMGNKVGYALKLAKHNSNFEYITYIAHVTYIRNYVNCIY